METDLLKPAVALEHTRICGSELPLKSIRVLSKIAKT